LEACILKLDAPPPITPEKMKLKNHMSNRIQQ
jgi:hypothetical protein